MGKNKLEYGEFMLENIKKAVSFVAKAYIIGYVLIPILIMILLFTLGVISDFFHRYRTTKISEEGQKELLELLKIDEAPSFEFIHIEFVDTYESYDCIEAKFKISKEDYERNKMKYGKSYEEMLLDCSYIEKEENEIYTCVVRRTDLVNKDYYNRIREIRKNYCKR